MVGINFFLASVYVFIKSHFPALGKYKEESFYSVLDKLLMMLFLGFQIYILKELSIENFILSISCAYLIAIGIALRSLNKVSPIRLRFSFWEVKDILRYSAGFALIGLFMGLYNRMDGVMLERLVDDGGYSAGVYAAGYRILDAANMFALLFASLLLPMFANLLIKDKDVTPLVTQAAQMMLVICVTIISAGYFYADEIMSFIYTDKAALYGSSFQILIISFFGIGMSYVFGTLITAGGRLLSFNFLLFIGICINWYFNLKWIPEETALGAAKATLITQIFMMIGQIYLVVTGFKYKLKPIEIIKILGFLVFAAAVSYGFNTLELNWMIKLISSSIIIIVASFLIGLIRLNTFTDRDILEI